MLKSYSSHAGIENLILIEQKSFSLKSNQLFRRSRMLININATDIRLMTTAQSESNRNYFKLQTIPVSVGGHMTHGSGVLSLFHLFTHFFIKQKTQKWRHNVPSGNDEKPQPSRGRPVLEDGA